MTPEELDAIEERCNAATPGPWWNESGVIHAPNPGVWREDYHSCIHPARCDEEEDAEFVAHAREDIPALIAAVREAWRTNEVKVNILIGGIGNR